MRSLRLLYGTVALALLLTGCQQQIPDTVKIGLAQPLSGPLAALGTDMRNGAELAIEVELTPSRGHLILKEEGVRYADNQAAVRGGVQTTDG
jgi:hypothetical protein